MAGGGAAAFPLGARAQESGRTFRIGMAEPVSAELNAAYLAAFRQELKRLGYVEGRNLVIEHRSADGDASRFPALLAELIALNVDLIVARARPRLWQQRRRRAQSPWSLLSASRFSWSTASPDRAETSPA